MVRSRDNVPRCNTRLGIKSTTSGGACIKASGVAFRVLERMDGKTEMWVITDCCFNYW